MIGSPHRRRVWSSWSNNGAVRFLSVSYQKTPKIEGDEGHDMRQRGGETAGEPDTSFWLDGE